MEVSPTIEKYMALEDSKNLFTLGLFRDEQLIGYSINFLQFNMHYSDLLVCQNDLLFVSKPFRGRIGLKLIDQTEKFAAHLGAKMMLWHSKRDTDFQSILERRDYDVQDIIYSKELI